MKEIRITPPTPLQMEDRDNGISLFCDGIEQDIAFLEFREDSGREYSDLTNEQVKAHAAYIVKTVNCHEELMRFVQDVIDGNMEYDDLQLNALVVRAIVDGK